MRHHPRHLHTRQPPKHAHAEYFIPAGVLLKCFLEVSDRELYDKLVLSVKGVSGQLGWCCRSRSECRTGGGQQRGARWRGQTQPLGS